jgi:hypothetical protein
LCCLGVVVCCVCFVLFVGRSRVLVCLLTCSLCVRGFLKAEILVLFFGFFEPKFEVENQTLVVGAGGGIRTPNTMAISPSTSFFPPNLPFFVIVANNQHNTYSVMLMRTSILLMVRLSGVIAWVTF